MRVTEPYIIFPRKLKSGKTVYYFQFRDNEGKRSSALSCGTSKLSEAKRVVKKLYLEGFFQQKSFMLFKNYTKDFFSKESDFYKWRVANGNSITDSTLSSYNQKLNGQLLPYFSETKMSAFSIDLIKKWVIWASEKWSAKTVNNAQGVLSLILESALEKKIINENSAKKISLRKIQKKHRELLSVSEISSLYKTKWPSEIERKAFLLAVCTGMRIGEVCGLQRKAVYKNYVDVYQSFSDKFGLGDTKTKLHRYVPLPNDFPFPESKTEWLFDGKNGNPVFPHSIYNSLIRLCNKLNINTKKRGITLHSTRNFFISYLQSENVSEAKIRAVVGHSEETMTDIYTYWTPEMFPEVYKAQEKLYHKITGEN